MLTETDARTPTAPGSPERAADVRTGGVIRWWHVTLVVLAAAVAADVVHWTHAPGRSPATTRQSTTPPVTVRVATVVRQDLPVRLSALGSVAAFSTVTVRPRIDGLLLQLPFQEGQFVNKGDVVAQIDPRPFEVQLEQAEGQLAKDQAQLNQAQTELTRYQLLLSEDSIARTNVDTQAATVKQLEGALKVDDAAIDAAKLNLSFTHVTSPIAGRVGLRQIDAGNLVSASTTPLVVVTQIEPIAVVFTLPEDALRIVLPRIRSRVSLPVDVFDRSGTMHLASGMLLAVDNQIDQTTGTVRLKATFDNRDRALFPSQFVNVQILADIRRNQIVIPAAAVQQGPEGAFVYAAHDGQATVRPVTVGAVSGDLASISQGLEPGTSVVVDGTDRLRDGSAVQIQSDIPSPQAPSS